MMVCASLMAARSRCTNTCQLVSTSDGRPNDKKVRRHRIGTPGTKKQLNSEKKRALASTNPSLDHRYPRRINGAEGKELCDKRSIV